VNSSARTAWHALTLHAYGLQPQTEYVQKVDSAVGDWKILVVPEISEIEMSN